MQKAVFSQATDSVFKDNGDLELKSKWDYYMENGYKIDHMVSLRQGGILVCFVKEV